MNHKSAAFPAGCSCTHLTPGCPDEQQRYSEWSLRATPEALRERHFQREGRDYVLVPEVRRMVAFEERNLVAEDPLWWSALQCDVIFCRNVLMYFSPDGMRTAVRQLTRALVPGGYLFLGHAETLRGLSNDFHLCHTHDTFYYQRRVAEENVRPLVADAARTVAPQPLPPAIDTSWIEVIRRASERVTSIVDQRSQDDAPRQSPAAVPVRGSWDLSHVHEAMKQERFVEALALLGELPPDSLLNPEALLLRAVLLANGGQPAEAEQVCGKLIALDELNAGAHYQMALCREHAGDAAGAVEHDVRAAYLDATFAMPHLHQGILARRRGDASSARRELSVAQALLVREDPARLLLFGGGFSRDTLINLCRSELSAIGGPL